MENYEQRLSTFGNWTNLNVNKEDLATAGFYSLGDGDSVKCAFCDGQLKYWWHINPWNRHAKNFPECPFVRDEKGAEFIKTIQDSENISQTNDVYIVSCYPSQSSDISSIPDSTPPVSSDLTQNPDSEQFDKYSGPQDNNSPDSTESDSVLKNTTSMTKEYNTGAKDNSSDLEIELEKSRRENEILKNEKICRICMEYDVKILFVPCNHLVTCLHCSLKVDKCPMCKGAIKEKRKVYM